MPDCTLDQREGSGAANVLIYVHNVVEERPEEDVGEHGLHDAVEPDVGRRLEERLRLAANLDVEAGGQQERGRKEGNKA